MRVLLIQNRLSVPSDLRNSVVAIGNFDGVHRGHQAVISRAAALAAGKNAPLVVLTFEPHPRSFFRPSDPPFRLTSPAAKARYMEALGVKGLAALPFDASLASMEAEDFIQNVLVGWLEAAHVVVGHDFQFGHNRRGTPEIISIIGGIPVTIVEAATGGDGEVYASSRIRKLIRKGQVKQAAALLGRPYTMEGRVVMGEQRGRDLGFPTANLEPGEYLHPCYGVYAVRVAIERSDGPEVHTGVANFGVRPTVDGQKVLLETHIFDFSGVLYGKTIQVTLMDFIRPEQKFAGVEALKAQIATDCRMARDILS